MDYRVYTDSSGDDSDVGAAAAIYKKGRARMLDELQVYVGSRAKHNTYEAEAIGGILGLWLVHNTVDEPEAKVS